MLKEKLDSSIRLFLLREGLLFKRELMPSFVDGDAALT